ncbi:dipeptide epimerase [Alicyclobacillus acidiphilus]|uniref:dipeptide epimerase n=1 Tax=Alicyclobacillus acidiphilus TaxID=182455 RepID=UPI000ABB4D4B|nr:dipeptide epimerase [Alicyclobacillus acidiphilus]
MKLVQASVEVREIPLRTTFRTALRSTSSVTDIRVRLETDEGLVGWGSASPTPAITGETEGSIVYAIERHLFPVLEASDLDDEHAVLAAIQRAIVRNTAAKAAVDIALHDLYAKRAGLPLWRRTGSQPGAIETDATVSLNRVEAMIDEARDYCAKGFKVLKVKLGGRDGLDMERLFGIRSSVDEEIQLRVDANQAWSAKEAIGYLATMEKLCVDYLEQPVPAWDLAGLAAVAQASSLPVVADESVFGMTDLLKVIDQRAADIVNLKLMKTGGITIALQMVQTIRAAGLDWMVGSMMEGPISVTAAAILAASQGCRHVDLDAGMFLGDHPLQGGISYEGPRIVLPSGEGVGIDGDRRGSG